MPNANLSPRSGCNFQGIAWNKDIDIDTHFRSMNLTVQLR